MDAYWKSIGLPFAGAPRSSNPPWFVPVTRPRIATWSSLATRSRISTLRSGNVFMAARCTIFAPSSPAGTPGIADRLLSNSSAKCSSRLSRSFESHASSIARTTVAFCSADMCSPLSRPSPDASLLAQAAEELLLVDDLDAERLGLGQLGAGTLPRHHEVRLLAHARGHLAARGLGPPGRLVA